VADNNAKGIATRCFELLRMAIRRQHQLFVEEFVATSDPVASYKRAYSRATTTSARVNAARLLRRDDVAAEIERLRAPVRAAVQEKAILTGQWIIEKLKLEVERKDSTPGARVAALRHLGDCIGLFQELPALDVLLSHVAAEHGEQAAALLRAALASAAERAKEQSVVDSGKSTQQPEQSHGARPQAEAANGQQTSAGAAQGSNQPAGPASGHHHVAGEPERGSGPLREVAEAATTAEGTTGNAGTLLGSRPASDRGQGAAAANPEGARESADQDNLVLFRRPTTEEDVKGMRCRPSFVPRHGTTADLD
jgi:hypothetical protein